MNKIILRFDLDELDEEGLARFFYTVKRFRIKAHVFALEYQVKDEKMNCVLKQFDSIGCKVGIHSEPLFPRTRLWKKPINFLNYGIVYVLSMLKNKNLIHTLVVDGLINQYKLFKKQGFNVDSHTFHAKNNSPGFDIETNWKLLTTATKEAGCFKTFFSHQRIMMVPKGLSTKQRFEPLSNPVRVEGDLVVYETCFDDIFFYTMKGNTMDFKENVIDILDWDEDNKVDTFTVNLHPYHAYTYNMYDLDEVLTFLNNQPGWRVVLK